MLYNRHKNDKKIKNHTYHMHKLLLAVLSQLIKLIGTDVNHRCNVAMVSTAWVKYQSHFSSNVLKS